MSFSAEMKAFLAAYQATSKTAEDRWWHDQMKLYYDRQWANTPAGKEEANRNASNPASAFTSSGNGGGSSGKPIATGDPVSKDLPMHARAFLNATAAPESGGAYNIRYNGKTPATFDPTGAHPDVRVPGPAGLSSAAGRYQITGTTWRDYLGANKLPGDTKFTPENQDKAAWWLANQRYPGLDAKLQRDGLTPDVLQKLGPTWKGFEDNPKKALTAYNQSMDRYRAPAPNANLSKLTDAQVEANNKRYEEDRAKRGDQAEAPKAEASAIPPPAPSASGSVSNTTDPAPGPQAMDQDSPNPGYWDTAEANTIPDQAIPDPAMAEFAARGGLIRRYADGGMVKKFEDGGLTNEESNAKYWTDQNASTPTPPPEALPITPASPPAQPSSGSNTSGPDTSGLPKLLDMGIQGLKKIIGVGGANTALPDTNVNPAAAHTAMQRGAGAISSDDYAAWSKVADPNNVLPEQIRQIQMMKMAADHYYQSGEKDKAETTIAGLIQYSLQVSKSYGAKSLALLKQDDPAGAAEAVEKGANQIPAGHNVKIDPKTLQFVITDVRSGKVLQKGALNHQTLVEAALGLASGGEAFKQLMKTASESSKEDGGPNAAYAAKIAAARGGQTQQAIPTGPAPAAPGTGAPPAGTPQVAAGVSPSALPTTPAAQAAGEDDDEEDTPATPAAASGPTPGSPAGASPAAPAAIPVAPAPTQPPASTQPPAQAASPTISFEPTKLPQRRAPKPPPPPDDPTDKGQKAQYAAAMTEFRADRDEYNRQRSEDLAFARAQDAQMKVLAAQKRNEQMRQQSEDRRSDRASDQADRRQKMAEEAELRKEARAAQTKPMELDEDSRQKILPSIQAQLNQAIAAGAPEEVRKKLPQQFYGPAAKVDLTDEAQQKSLADDPEIRAVVGPANHQAMTELALQIYRYQPSIGVKNAAFAAQALTTPQREVASSRETEPQHTALPFVITPISGGEPRAWVSFTAPGVTTPHIVVPKSMLDVARAVRGDRANVVDKQDAASAQEQSTSDANANRQVDLRNATKREKQVETRDKDYIQRRSRALATDPGIRDDAGAPWTQASVRTSDPATIPTRATAATALPVGEGPPDARVYPGAGAPEFDAALKRYAPSGRYMKSRQDGYGAARGNLATTRNRGDESALRMNPYPGQKTDTLPEAARKIYQAIPAPPR